MTVSRAVRLVARTLTTVVLAVSGVYLIVYLYRWEWNRALISGTFFLGAELAVVADLLFARLGRLERRLEEAPAPRLSTPPEPPSEVDVARESPFAWLDPASGRLGVFVPLLMGAGVILSAVAFLIEKVSAAVPRAGSSPSVRSFSPPPAAARRALTGRRRRLSLPGHRPRRRRHPEPSRPPPGPYDGGARRVGA